MITLTVAAILLSLAAPSFRDIIKDNRLITEINRLSASLNLGRSESIKRSLTVTVCKSDDAASCGGDWHNGWIVFVDVDGDGSVDSGDGDELIKVSPALTSGTTLIFPNKNRVTYNADGFSVGFNSTFKLCDDRGASNAKGLVVSPTGRVRTATSSDLASCS